MIEMETEPMILFENSDAQTGFVIETIRTQAAPLLVVQVEAESIADLHRRVDEINQELCSRGTNFRVRIPETFKLKCECCGAEYD
jgi:hypothetical protein